MHTCLTNAKNPHGFLAHNAHSKSHTLQYGFFCCIVERKEQSKFKAKDKQVEKLILHLIGQYEDVSDGGGVGASLLACWIDTTRQGANYHLRKMWKDKLLKRCNVGSRGSIPTYRYKLSDKSRELYENGKFKNSYFENVYKKDSVANFDKLSMRIIGQ